MKTYFLTFLLSLISLKTVSQTACTWQLFSAERDHPPGCLLCETLLEVSTTGYTKDTFQIDFPCGPAPEKTQWYSIFPDIDNKISLIVLTEDCTTGIGVQAAIFDQSFNLVSNCYSDNGNNLGTLNANNLNPWEHYYLMIDGKNGSDCQFLVGLSVDTEVRTLDTMICHGSCVYVGDTCYYESQAAAFIDVCSNPIPLNIHFPDTSNFEIKTILDSFTNLLTFDWNVRGADSFDVFIDDVFIRNQSTSFYTIPFSSVQAGIIKIKVIPYSRLGCSFKTSETEIQVPGSSNISNQQGLEKLVVIAPNPSKDIFRITSKIAFQKVEVYDLTGREKLTSKSNSIDLSDFEYGIYLLKIQTPNGIVLKRVLKI